MDSNEYKIDTEFRLALDVDYETRIKALNLDVGYDSFLSVWEVIVIYNGNLQRASEEIGFSYIELLRDFAILRIKESDIDRLKDYPEILFIDKPKQLYIEQTEIIDACEQSCIQVEYEDMFGNNYLTGKGVLVAILDSGIDLSNKRFMNEDGTSRVLYFWDQTTVGNGPAPYNFGTEYKLENISDSALFNNYDESGHGSAVASIVAGCATNVKLLIVKLSNERGEESKTTALICAIDYVIRIAQRLQMPLVINISYGNYYGDHAGNSVLETYIDAVSTTSKLSVVVGTGNDGNTGRHKRINVKDYNYYQVEFVVNQYETAINLQIWYSFFDDITFKIIDPEGNIWGPIKRTNPITTYDLFDMKILAISSLPSTIADKQELYFSFVPNNTYILAGVYKILIETGNVIEGNIDLWLPVANSTNSNVSFLAPTPEITLTIPSTAQSVISVGAYDLRTDRYAIFSGRGYDANGRIKPDLCAPGVQIKIIGDDNHISFVSGTSFATPFVSAAAAMLMEWGIVEGNDPFLYGQKLKAFLTKGARPLIGDITIPNTRTGYGALCLENSLKL